MIRAVQVEVRGEQVGLKLGMWCESRGRIEDRYMGTTVARRTSVLRSSSSLPSPDQHILLNLKVELALRSKRKHRPPGLGCGLRETNNSHPKSKSK